MIDGSSIKGLTTIEESDVYLYPDLNSYYILNENNIQYICFFCFLHDINRKHLSSDSRYLLYKEQNKYLEQLFIGFEVEFYFLKNNRLIDKDCYLEIENFESINIRQKIVNEIEKVGIVIESFHHENGNGQNEISLKYVNALKACDNLQLFKYISKRVCFENNIQITFIPKLKENLPGNGLHVNCSLYNDYNLFNNKEDLSEIGYRFICGILEHAKDFCLITNPTVNSYKRLVNNTEAPTLINYSICDRSSMIRIPKNNSSNKRVEIRNVDFSSNPYLVCSSLLLFGQKGIIKKLEKNNNFNYNANTKNKLPNNLYDSIECFKKSTIIDELLDFKIKDYIIEEKLKEWTEYENKVHLDELEKYLNI